MWKEYYCVTSLDEALKLLADHREKARIVAGATDLILEMERGVRKGIDILIDITRVLGLDRIVLDEDEIIHLGPLVTHNHCAASKLVVERAYPLARAAWEVGAPQIRNRGTVAGNLITASPANDTIPPLLALGGRVVLRSLHGERVVPLDEFYTGVRGTVMQPDELLVDIAFPAMRSSQRGTFIKLGLRQAQAISLVSVAMVVNFRDGMTGSAHQSKIDSAVITLGAVAPTVVRAHKAEAYLEGRTLDMVSIEEAARLAVEDARPIGDIRSSAEYRHEMVRICTLRGLRSLSKGEERQNYPETPILLGGKDFGQIRQTNGTAAHFIAGDMSDSPILTRINGKEYRFPHGHQKTLLRLIREDAGLTGTKEGCAEGECGACTVFLDGMAVMSCLVPAPRAHGAVIETIEGLIQAGNLHPVQQAFIDEGAVQCGYCTPGFVMSGVKLLEEQPHPTHDEVRQAITGNLCRCTGYYKIVRAIEQAAGREVLGES